MPIIWLSIKALMAYDLVVSYLHGKIFYKQIWFFWTWVDNLPSSVRLCGRWNVLGTTWS